MVGLEGRAVGVAEGDGELLVGELHVLGERDAGEVETAGKTLVRFNWGGERRGNAPDEPDKTLCGDVLLGLELVDDELLEGLGFERGGELAVADFLGAG